MARHWNPADFELQAQDFRLGIQSYYGEAVHNGMSAALGLWLRFSDPVNPILAFTEAPRTHVK